MVLSPFFVTPECICQGSTVFKNNGCLTKDFRHGRREYKGGLTQKKTDKNGKDKRFPSIRGKVRHAQLFS